MRPVRDAPQHESIHERPEIRSSPGDGKLRGAQKVLNRRCERCDVREDDGSVLQYAE